MRDGLLRISNPQLSQAFRVKSHLTTAERVALYWLALRKETILEIGSYVGASTCCFGAALKKNKYGKVLCIDTWKNDAMSEGPRDTYAEFLKNTEPFSKFIIPIRGFSTEVTAQVGNYTSHVDLLFIDGDHTYDGVKADWNTYRGFLEIGSVIAFHDWGWAEGVKRVVLEDVMPLVSTYGSLPNMWWGKIKTLSC